MFQASIVLPHERWAFINRRNGHPDLIGCPSVGKTEAISRRGDALTDEELNQV